MPENWILKAQLILGEGKNSQSPSRRQAW